MLEKVKFKTWILLLHTSAISKSYSTYKKVSVGLWNFDNGGSKLVIICLAKKSSTHGKSKKKFSKKCSPKLLFLIEKKSD